MPLYSRRVTSAALSLWVRYNCNYLTYDPGHWSYVVSRSRCSRLLFLIYYLQTISLSLSLSLFLPFFKEDNAPFISFQKNVFDLNYCDRWCSSSITICRLVFSHHDVKCMIKTQPKHDKLLNILITPFTATFSGQIMN